MFKILIAVLFLLAGCSQIVVAPASINESLFPKVSGTSLTGTQLSIPDHFAGKPTVLLIGYVQKAQFDIDRWILGLLQADVKVEIAELPTIAGMMPQMVQSFINNGMRRGIPQTDWASVITVYEDADKIVKALGNEKPQNAQVVVLNSKGAIKWFSNEGYSAAKVLQIKKLVESNNFK